ncbi:URC4/urg3 family protein [Mycolicibacterium lacusdiani]|uniref:URC4/urg3 family protein n=1 Tax=Mycolicibacterium lacusdiani TaxID=2895283 RepID=UPI001F410C22|nr:URC4/urg3 family protein [Mycolicibacterium lacusdiani]
MSSPESAAAALRSTTTVRERAAWLLARARADESPWFTVDDDEMPGAATLVAQTTRTRYPDLAVPFHSRWRHFEAGGVDRKAILDDALPEPRERLRAMIDLAVVSVLLDAGAGPDWHYREAGGDRYSRSEGLGVASFHAFTAGVFSSDPSHPLRADADGLHALRVDDIARALQADASNPLVGLDGRVEVLRRLGNALADRPDVFGRPARPGGMASALIGADGHVTAHAILTALLSSLSDIWPSANAIDGVALGDCWRHDAVPGPGLTAGWVPFHKLSQWLTYSLLEPFQWAGVTVDGLDALTGLPEYRNGGLLLDTGVLALRDAEWASRTWTACDELVVEWRALTVALLDELADLVRGELGVDVPLACVLEGGTWATGRILAKQLRGGLPPLTIDSDGTVF